MDSRVLECRENDSAVRIGVVGHRMNRLTAEDTQMLEAPIRTVIDDLQRSASAAIVSLHVVTSLAEGADRILAREAVARGMLETVVLPFNRECFEQDFTSEASKTEFHELLEAASTVIEPPPGGSIAVDDGYREASAIVVACADMLIAVWNGEPGEGPGGTAHSIKAALGREIPVIWIRSNDPYSVEVIEPDGGLAESPLATSLERIRLRHRPVQGTDSSGLARQNLNLMF